MRDTFQHMGDHDSCESARNLFLFFNAIYLDSDVSHRIRDLLRCQATLEIVLKPIVRKLHNYLFFNIFP